MNKIFAFSFFSFLFLLIPSEIIAAFSFNIESFSPASVSSKDGEINVNLSITDLPNESYFRVAWQKLEGGSYFGFVKNNNGEWIEIKPLSGDCLQYYKVSDTSTTAISLITKIGENTDILPGIYRLKAHRFTAGSCSNTASDNEVEITVNTSTPTPSPTSAPTATNILTSSKTPTPTKTPTPIKSVSTPTNTQVVKNPTTPILKSTSAVIAQSANTDSSIILSDSDAPLVLGEGTSSSQSSNKKNSLVSGGAKISLVLGMIFCGFSIIIFSQKYKTLLNQE